MIALLADLKQQAREGDVRVSFAELVEIDAQFGEKNYNGVVFFPRKKPPEESGRVGSAYLRLTQESAFR